MREGSRVRDTQETHVHVRLRLEGTGKAQISTGIGFFDHMLEQIARHALLDLDVEAKGDLHIDDHHTVEDVGIAFGQALHQALGDCRGICRYAHAYLPMDEALTRVALDISGRPFLVFRTPFHSPKIGTFDTQLVQEFFQAVAIHAKITLHMESLYGQNDHHVAESCFKGFAQALKAAIAIEARQSDVVPSTKGVLGE